MYSYTVSEWDTNRSQALYEKLIKTMIRRLACSTTHEQNHTFHHLSRWSETCLSSSAKHHSLEASLHLIVPVCMRQEWSGSHYAAELLLLFSTDPCKRKQLSQQEWERIWFQCDHCPPWELVLTLYILPEPVSILAFAALRWNVTDLELHKEDEKPK